MSAQEAPKVRGVPQRPSDAQKPASGPIRAPAEALAALDDWLVQPLTPEFTGVEAAPARSRRPWDGIDPAREQQMNVDIPAILHAKLRYVVRAKYGVSLKAFVNQAIEAAVAAELKEQEKGG